MSRAQPAAGTFDGRTVGIRDTAEDVEGDAVARDGVFDRAGWFKGCRVKADGRFGDLIDVGFAVDFNAWEFPKVRVDDSRRSLANENARVSVDDEGEETPRSGGSAAWEVWE